jgi:hypothetical protein
MKAARQKPETNYAMLDTRPYLVNRPHPRGLGHRCGETEPLRRSDNY